MNKTILRTMTISILSYTISYSGEAMDYSMPAEPMAEKQVRQQEFPIPPITLVKDGEFVVQKIRIVNDSRNEETRYAEMRETIQLIVNKAKDGGFELRFGQSIINNENFKDIPISGYANKSDVSSVKIEIKKDINPKDKGAVVSDIDKAIASLKLVGRSEIIREEFGIGILNPEKFRYEIIQAIVKDAKTVQALMGDDYQYNISGLDKRIRWVRYSFNQLELVIDYSCHISVKDRK